MLTASEGQNRFVELSNQAVGDQLKLLIESKHIYQKVSIDIGTLKDQVRKLVSTEDAPRFDQLVSALIDQAPLFPSPVQHMSFERTGEQVLSSNLLLRNVKVFCARCDEVELHKPVAWNDPLNYIQKPFRSDADPVRLPPQTFQLYILVYQCQNCFGNPNAFLVKRDKWQLYLDGRSPFEQVIVPKFIPKSESRFYRDALIASHGGKTLAALFYLRTFVEQFARRLTSQPGRVTGEELMASYNALLPPSLRDQMPSLAHWYERLSEALHSARGDDALFEQAKDALDQHFEIRRVHRIPEP